MTRSALPLELREAYSPPKGRFVILDVPPMDVLSIEGHGDPNGGSFRAAIEALYAVAYSLKFSAKKGEPLREMHVAPLEGAYFSSSGGAEYLSGNREAWHWKLQIPLAVKVSEKELVEAKTKAAAKRELPALDKLTIERLDEGTCVETMYVGPYDKEGATILKMHEFLAEEGYAMAGPHREIYMGDPRRSKPENLKTILRQPVRKVSKR